MRTARVKPVAAESPVGGTYYHLVNRIAGFPGDFPFGDREKERFIQLMKQLLRLYTIEPVAWMVMGNHFHILAFAPATAPSPVETARRYEAYYNGKRWLEPASEKCLRTARRMIDISLFMRDLQFQFSGWFNRSRPVRRRGRLWGDRFKSAILEGPGGVWECLKYVTLNPVRAKLVTDPADYRFSAWGEWNGTGAAPYAASLLRHLRHSFGERAATWEFADFHRELRSEFARVRTAETHALPDDIEKAMAEAAMEPALLGVLNRRVRYWTDGLVIGSSAFLPKVMNEFLPAAAIARHRPGPKSVPTGVVAPPAHGQLRVAALLPPASPVPELRAWRRLRIQQT